MTVRELDGEFDCAQYISDVSAVANVLWSEARLPMVILDAAGQVMVFNPAAEPYLGDENIRIGDQLTEQLRHIWLDDEVDECPPQRRPLNRAYAGEVVRSQCFRYQTTHFVEQGRMRVTAVPVALLDGSRGVLLGWEDVTEEGQAERREQRTIRRFEQLLLDSSDYSIIVLNRAHRVQSWGISAEKLYGYCATEAIGLDYGALFGETDKQAGRPLEMLRQAEQSGSTRIEQRRARRDGELFWAEGAVSALRDDAGEVCGFVEVAHDGSQKRASEQEILTLNDQLRGLNQELEERIAARTEQLVRQAADLRAANAELETFSYSVSHNLRAPLRAVGGYTRLIEEQFPKALPAEVVGHLHKLNRSAAMMGALIDGLLELSRTQRISLEIENLDMAALVSQCWDALSEERTGRTIVLSVGELPNVEGDRRLIGQVWFNLLQNAIKYTRSRAEAQISVTAGAHDGVVSYRVEDNGVGFDMKYAHKIGQMFERLHDGSDFPGTGIGIATVQRIVHRHGGALTVQGELNVGAAVEFSLWTQQ